MAEHLKNPSAIVIDSHSAFALHKMTICTRKWNAGIGTGGFGGFLNWLEEPVDAQEMVQALVGAMVVLHHGSYIYDRFTIYDEVSEGGAMVPKSGFAISDGEGTNDTPGWYQGVEFIYTYFDTEFNKMTHKLLDFASLNNFARRSPITFSVDEAAVIAQISDESNAWASRAGFRPSQIRSGSVGINDALKAKYPGI